MLIPTDKEMRTVISVPFDKNYFANEMLSKIFYKRFSVNGEMEYDIVVSGFSDSIVYTNTKNVTQKFYSSADLDVPFLSLPAFEADFRPPPERDFRDRRNAPPPFPLDRDKNFRPRPLNFDKQRLQYAFWLLFIKHRGGSLKAVVEKNRWKNIVISFSIMLLLGASVIFLLLSSHRSQQLAQQQLQFVASISHELRTPLAVLKSAGENLADGVIQQKERTKQYGELIKTEVHRLSEMVEKSLLFAGIQSGKQTYEFQPIDIFAILESSVNKAKKFPSKITFTIETKIEKNLPKINGNAAAVQSVIDNLLINAIKYNCENGTIIVAAERILNSSYIKISISDSGIGISGEDLKHIFKPFQRGHNAVDAQIEGSGLGLNIAKHIIEAHGGAISVRSALNKGSEFTIQLPAL